MVNEPFMKLFLTKKNNGYLLAAKGANGHWLSTETWKFPLFSRHPESYYGAFIDPVKVDGMEMLELNAWQLVTLFARESFNRFFDWDWDEASEICLSSAHVLYESILEKEWLPDFKAWEAGTFRWRLPSRVREEFDSSFWEQGLSVEGFGLGGTAALHSTAADGGPSGEDEAGLLGVRHDLAQITAYDFIEDLYNLALDAYLTRNKEMREVFGPKLELLEGSNIPAATLARYFDEEKWLEWAGIKENPAPFSIGLRLDEPEDGEGFWLLEMFLRGKRNPDELYRIDDPAVPKSWKPFVETAYREEERWVALIPSLGVYDRLKTSLSEEEAWVFLTESSEVLVALGVEILLPGWWEAMKKANMRVKASVKGTSSNRPSFVGLDAMLDFNWRFSMNGVDLSEDEFRSMVEDKRRLVYVRGRWVKLDPAFIRQIQEMMKKAEKEGLHVRDLLEQELTEEPEGDDLENPRAFAKIQIELNRQWKQMMKQLREINEIPLVPVPDGLNGTLRPYQQLGMSWLLFLRQFGFGAILADDMGLGKTIQLISCLLSAKEKAAEEAGPAKKAHRKLKAEETPDSAEDTDGGVRAASKEDLAPSLIICPTSVLGNWQKELERFAPELRVHLHYGSSRLKGEAFAETAAGHDVVLTSYGLTHLDEEEFSQIEWDTIAIDEAQNIKNAQTKQSRAVRKLRGRHHIALTGTPMENRLSELWSIFDFTNHGYLGSIGQFQKRFAIPIEKEENAEKVRELQALIRPFLLRRTKKDEEVALNLPDKLEQKEYCPLTAEQASLYEQLVQDTFTQLEKLTGFERKGMILQLLSKLKQLCNHPALYLKEWGTLAAGTVGGGGDELAGVPANQMGAADTAAEVPGGSGGTAESGRRDGKSVPERKNDAEVPNRTAGSASSRNLVSRSAKMEKLVELIDAVLEQGESCIIFTQYLDMGEMIRSVLKAKFGIDAPFLNGSVPKAKRDDMIERFQNHEFPVFLLSLKAGGTGLNLTAANHVIHYDRWWNPAVENQATDRAYRIGQQLFVHVHKLICTGTLEEKIDAMLEKKQHLNDQVIQSENWITELSTDELRDLVLLK
ncbi:DEAD/DEAH box helicase [Bacillus sp. B-jedd]|uniref:DEAD/DEAH box helicase n=1 Tax=Bacillus sp. B-jedd TaxID=1476857 RepID=UPI0005156E1A|nr:DEAD/DEAH box helicase [Bacillus sp. B-jedd]CEG29135.1 helicase YwqA [Bacillus sp. B-jedd]